jgi:hypothetical protein
MWIDELYSFYIMQQPTARDLLTAVREGCDGAPPTYALIARAVARWVGDPVLALRLPAMLGVGVFCICVFAFAVRRLPTLYALMAMLLACNACLFFATDGRCYGLVLGCAALSLLCWQLAAERWRRGLTIPALAISLALAMALHYYSLFLLAPLFAGELARWRMRGRPDMPVLIALSVAPLALIPLLPFIQAEARFSTYVWARAHLPEIQEYYLEFFGRYLILIVLPALWFLTLPPATQAAIARHDGDSGLRTHEWVVCGATILTPALVVLISMLTTNTFTTRYVAWAVAGFSIAAAAAAFRACRGNSLTAFAAGGLLLMALCARIGIHLISPALLREGQPVADVLRQAGADAQPIVVADHHAFMELAYYAPAPLRQRLVYAASPELSRMYTNVDTGELLLSALRYRTRLNIQNYGDFVSGNSHFLLAAGAGDWLIWHLVRSGYRVVPVRAQWNLGLFEVDRPSR